MSVNLLAINQTALDERAVPLARTQLGVWLAQQTDFSTSTDRATPAVSVPQSFSEQVARAPEAIALVSNGTSWTYRELEEAANRLAHLVAAHSAGPGAVIALMFEPSAQAIIAMLAVLKTGATYLPIDPALSDAEVAFLLDDAAPKAAITVTTQAGRLAHHDLPVIDINDPVINTSYPTHALPHPNPDNVAYILYPSVATGSPRGLAVTHHNIANQNPSDHRSIWEIWGGFLRTHA